MSSPVSVDHCSISGLFGGRPTGPLIRDPRAVSAGVRGKNTGLAHRSGPYFHSHPEVAGSLAYRAPGRDRLGRTAASLPPSPRGFLCCLPRHSVTPLPPLRTPTGADPCHPACTGSPFSRRALWTPDNGHPASQWTQIHGDPLCVWIVELCGRTGMRAAGRRRRPCPLSGAWDPAHQLHIAHSTVLSAQYSTVGCTGSLDSQKA